MADTNIEIKLKDVRLSFDNLFEPQVQEGDKVDPNTGQKVKDISYNCVLLLDKVTHADQIKAVTEAMVAAREAKWPGQNKKIPAERRCMRDGEPEIARDHDHAGLGEGAVQLGNQLGLLSSIHANLHFTKPTEHPPAG